MSGNVAYPQEIRENVWRLGPSVVVELRGGAILLFYSGSLQASLPRAEAIRLRDVLNAGLPPEEDSE